MTASIHAREGEACPEPSRRVPGEPNALYDARIAHGSAGASPSRIDVPRVARASVVVIALRCLLLIGPAILVSNLLRVPQPLIGDGFEYATTLLAWINHASPDVRPQDVAAVSSPFTVLGYDGLLPNMSETSSTGARYTTHFWFYPLVCAPAALLLRAVGITPIAAFPVTNVLIFVSLIAVGVWSRRITPRDQTMIALAAVSPVLSYLRFAHPEMCTWACVLASLLALNAQRYGLGAALAAFGSMQNPPVASLAAFAVVLAAREVGWRAALRAVPAAALCVVPPLFYFATVGQPFPLARPGFVDWHLATPARMWSMLIDLDQGVLPYMPGLLVLAAASLPHARSVRHLGMVAVLLLFMIGLTPSENWNSTLTGLMRYAVWVIPVLAWLATESTRAIGSTALGVVLAVHAALLVAPGPASGTHSRLATYALTHWPSWYHSDPEIFAEHLIGLDWVWRARLPLGIARNDGTMAQILTTSEALAGLDHDFLVDTAYRGRVMAESSQRTGMFFLVPPFGAVRSRCESRLAAKAHALDGIRIRATLPDHMSARQVPLIAEISNASIHALCNLGAGGTAAVNVAFRAQDAAGRISDFGGRTRIAQVLLPGESVQQPMTLALPEHSGRYAVSLLPVIEGIAWGDDGPRFIIDVQAGGDGSYAATAEPGT